MNEQNIETSPELEIPSGLSAIFLPDMKGVDPTGQEITLTEKDSLAKMNEFLSKLNAMGVEIKATIPVSVPVEGGFGGGGSTTKQMAIVKR